MEALTCPEGFAKEKRKKQISVAFVLRFFFLGEILKTSAET